MGRFRAKNTKPEIVVRKALHAAGRRFRIHRKDLPGKPDIVLPRGRVVVLVHGCFWHGHVDCPIARVPKTRSDFWIEKFAKNRSRDLKVQRELEDLGWRVVVIWECEAKSRKLSAIMSERGLI